MAIDSLQEKIRKTKNPSMLCLTMSPAQLPPQLAVEEEPGARYGRFCQELLTALKGTLPAVRVGFGAFALLGPDGLRALETVLKTARNLGYYTVLDAPELLFPGAAEAAAESLLGAASRFVCDGVVVSGYLGSDILKPFLPYTQAARKDVFVVVRTPNRSATELQDLRCGTRTVHLAAADYVNRYAGDTAGRYGYARVGLLASASSAQSLQSLRTQYPGRFLLVDGYDYPNGSGKACACAFDRLGHGAVACAGVSITCAWKEAGTQGEDFREQALAAAERMKKNLRRYVTVL